MISGTSAPNVISAQRARFDVRWTVTRRARNADQHAVVGGDVWGDV
jgi:hypothetical protein